MDEMQRVVIATELKKVLDEVAGTRNPNSLRARLDREAVEAYNDPKNKKKERTSDVAINGINVATYSVRKSKKTTSTELHITDWNAFGDWTVEPSLMMEYILADNPTENIRKLAEWVMRKTGEVPDGCDVVEVETPERAIGMTLRIDHAAFAEAVGALPEQIVLGLLEGGE